MEKSIKTQILREDYPLNLFKAIEAEKTQFQFSIEEITADKLEGLEYALTELTERERQISPDSTDRSIQTFMKMN